MITAKQIAVGLVTQAEALRRDDPKSKDAKWLLDVAGEMMAVEITGRSQK